MAKAAMRPEVKAQKLKNNKVFALKCHTKDCENEFYVATFNALGQSKRKCKECYDNPPEPATVTKNRELLTSLGLL